jgi:hypothetical protein
MKAPKHTVPTAYQCALGRLRILSGRRGSTRKRRHPSREGSGSAPAGGGRGCPGRVTLWRAAATCSLRIGGR